MQGANTYVLTPSAAALSTFQHIHCVELHLCDIVPKHCVSTLSWHVREQVPYGFEYTLHLQDQLQTMYRGSMRSADTVLLLTYPRSSNKPLPCFVEFKATFAAPCETATLQPAKHAPVPCVWEHRMFLNIVPVHNRPDESQIHMDPVPAAATDVTSTETSATSPEEKEVSEESQFWNLDATSDADDSDNSDETGDGDGVGNVEDVGNPNEEEENEDNPTETGSDVPQLPSSRSTPIHLLASPPECSENGPPTPSQTNPPTRQVGRCRVVKRLA